MGRGKLLKDIGEFGLIEEIKKRTLTNRSVRVGIGDDAAVLRSNRRQDILFATDMLIEDRHFRLSEASAFEIGWKALAVNISDIAAMGGRPTYAVVSLGLPKHLPVNFVREFYRGFRAVARRFDVQLVGGDTNESAKLVASVALLGETIGGRCVKRSGAKIGDIIFVTGALGGSYISRKHLRFMPRVKEAQFLARYFKPSAMMDISDGLASDIQRLTEASRVGASLNEAAIPVSRSANSAARALTDGEDFELLFTLPVRTAERLLRSATKKKSMRFYPIGRIVHRKEGITLIGSDGRRRSLLKKGFDHFRTRSQMTKKGHVR